MFFLLLPYADFHYQEGSKEDPKEEGTKGDQAWKWRQEDSLDHHLKNGTTLLDKQENEMLNLV